MAIGEAIVLRPCICGKPGTRFEITTDDGDESAICFACDDCRNATTEFLALMRPVFDAMIAVGVGREIANETMGFLLERMDGESKCGSSEPA